MPKPPVDFQGKPYAPGQKVVRPYLQGCSPFLELRTVLAVEEDTVIVGPSGGESRPRALKRHWRACIL